MKHVVCVVVLWLCLWIFAASAQESLWSKQMSDASRAMKANQLIQAQQLYEKARLEAQKFGSKDPRLDQTLIALAQIYKTQKNWTKAEAMCREVVAFREKNLGPDHLGYAQSLNNLAVVLELGGKNSEADKAYNKALKIVETALGPENRYTAMILDNYAVLLRKTSRMAEAERCEKRAKDIRNAERTLVGAAAPAEVAAASVGIAATTQGRQRVVEEESDDKPPGSQTSSAQIGPQASRFFQQDVNEMLAMANLPYQYMSTADSYKDKGDLRRAEKLYKMALEAAQLSSGPKSMQTVLCLGSLAMCYDKAGKFALAEPLFKRQVVIYAHMPELDEWRLGLYAKEYADILRKVGNSALAAQVDQFQEHVDDWINSPSSRNASYCAWLNEDQPPESTEFVAYQKEVERRIKEHWSPPFGESYAPPVVVFSISHDGTISHLEISHTSESLPVDQAALRAVSQAAPFPSLPPETSFDVQVEYTFDKQGKCVIHHQ